MSKPPEIIIGSEGIENWDEIYHWACDNDPIWRSCLQAYRHLSKERFLETLTAYLLQAKFEITEVAMQAHKEKAVGWRFDWSADK